MRISDGHRGIVRGKSYVSLLFDFLGVLTFWDR